MYVAGDVRIDRDIRYFAKKNHYQWFAKSYCLRDELYCLCGNRKIIVTLTEQRVEAHMLPSQFREYSNL